MATLKGESARPSLRLALIVFCIIHALLIVGPVPANAQCSDPVTGEPVEEQVSPLRATGSSVAIRQDGDFLVTWSQRTNPGFFPAVFQIRAQRYCPSGLALGTHADLSEGIGSNRHPSLAASRNGHCHVAWLGVGPGVSIDNDNLVTIEFDWDDFESIEPVPTPPASEEGGVDATPSAGASDGVAGHAAVAWANRYLNEGLHLGIDGTQVSTLRSCETGTVCNARINQWRPCVATRSEDGITALAFAYDEDPNESISFLNIALMIFDAEGNLLEQLAGPDIHDPELWVNDPSREDPSPEDQTSQVSPAVSFVGDDIVVVWAGPDIAACQGTAVDRVYARRFKFDISAEPVERLRDPDPLADEGRAGIFVVDTDDSGIITNPNLARPSVAITLAEDDNSGRFVVSWNTRIPEHNRREIHAQYFDRYGQPRGAEFRVNQDTETTFGSVNERYLFDSAQHTIAYGADDQLVATWGSRTPDEFNIAHDIVSFTLLPPDHAWTTFPDCEPCNTEPGLCDPCRKGDVNGDCNVDGLDI